MMSVGRGATLRIWQFRPHWIVAGFGLIVQHEAALRLMGETMCARKLGTTALRAIEAAYNEGLLERLDELYAPDAIYHRPPLTDIEGLDDLKAYIADLRRTFSELHYTLEETTWEGMAMGSRWTLRGRHTGRSPSMPVPPTGREITITGCSMVHYAQGKIEEEWNHADWLGFFQQLNVIPPVGQAHLDVDRAQHASNQKAERTRHIKQLDERRNP
jgi:predicted ester cyclase